MKKILILITTLVFVMSQLSFANVYDMSQVSQAKLVTSYSENTTVDQMDTVTFGSYYQSNSSTKEPIEWIVLDRQGNKALLLSKYILDCKCYNDVYKDITWENCTLRYWLNNTFYNTAFSSSEKSYIDNTYVINNDNAIYNTIGGNNTYDNVFLLSIDEVNKYFYQSDMHTNKRPATRGTNYAKNVDNNGYKLRVNNSSSEWYNDNSYFWLRSPGYRQDSVAHVDYKGHLYDGGFFSVNYFNFGVRPALWVSNLSSSISKSNVEVFNTNDNVIRYLLYNDILSNIQQRIIMKEYDWDYNPYEIGISDYLGYQLYDIDDDGIKELFIFRCFTRNNSNQKQVYLHCFYTIENGQVICKLGSDANYEYGLPYSFALKDGRIFFYGYDNDNAIRSYRVKDYKSNTEIEYFIDYPLTITKNGVVISKETAKAEINNLESQIGYFNIPLETKLIEEDYTIESSNKTSNRTIVGLPYRSAEWRSDNHFYLDDSMQRNKWVYYVTDYYHVDGQGNIERNKWIEQRYVGSDGKMYRGRQTPDGQYVGDNGLIVNVAQDLYYSVMAKTADPDSWYQTQSGLWYYFENDRTTTKKGWFKDYRDDQWYYFDLITGIMQVGWQKIDGKDYYFNEFHTGNNWYEVGGGFFESYGKKVKAYGSMFKSEKTPDGYWVNWNGEYIKNGNFFLAINPITYLWIILVVLIIIIVAYYLRKKNVKINDIIVVVINKFNLLIKNKPKNSK